ncbi:MAG: hypothetical protein WB762_24480 [Candidatus Sulfotelmatobacter sp.]
MIFSARQKPQRSLLWKASLLLTLVSGLLIAADQISIRCGLSGSERIADDLLGGLIAGSLFYLYERHKMRQLIERLRVIELMNHHIRNALQPLMFVTSQSEDNATKLVKECVQHIDWALREVLPGRSAEQFGVQVTDFPERSGLTIASRTQLPPLDTAISPRRRIHGHPKPFFSHWLHSWRERNEKAS